MAASTDIRESAQVAAWQVRSGSPTRCGWDSSLDVSWLTFQKLSLEGELSDLHLHGDGAAAQA